MIPSKQEKVAVIGLGYVGLPLALALAEHYQDAYGFDINQSRVEALKGGSDSTGETEVSVLRATSLKMTCALDDIAQATFFIVSVPTPIDERRQPDLTPLLKASETVGKVLKKGDIVVYESTVYPGVTEDFCGAVLARVSGLTQGVDFKLGYSPERINPGDKEHTIERIVKVVSAEDRESLQRVADVYGSVVKAGLHRAPSIKVAEAAKVIENTQRDLNIALMNELAIIFDRLNIRTSDVLAAASTKWNFLKFTPGLVGGHCIGVDPYYLTSCAEQTGYHPQVILAGRRINDGMGAFIAQKTVKLLIEQGLTVKGAKVGVLGLTFKEDVPDLRNSRVPDIIKELSEFGIEAKIHDPLADAAEAQHEYGLTLSGLNTFADLDVVILAVSHKEYRNLDLSDLQAMTKQNGIIVDIKSVCVGKDWGSRSYWSL